MEFDYITERVKANNLTLLTDLYQLTMMNGYEICGLDKTRAFFDAFYRGTGGFGYDPLFFYEPMGKTYAEMNEEEKNEISHRARAAREMVKIMDEISRKKK